MSRRSRKKAHPVDRGENQPVVSGQAVQGGVEFGVIDQGLDGDGGELDDAGPQGGKAGRAVAGLFAGAGDHHGAAEQGPFFKPVEFVAQPNHLAHHDDRGIGEALAPGGVGQVGQGGGQGTLVIGGAPVHQGGRGVGLQTGVDEVAGDIGQVFHAHDEDEGGSAAGQGLPVVHRTRFGGVFVPGDQGHG